jgi:hypothetical protein
MFDPNHTCREFQSVPLGSGYLVVLDALSSGPLIYLRSEKLDEMPSFFVGAGGPTHTICRLSSY